MNPLSVYVHVPFCAKKCRYCDFYSVPGDESLAGSYLSALEKEICLLKKHGAVDADAAVGTVFIGGGTPTTLSVPQLASLCALLRSAFVFTPGFEWTVECNPESFSPEKAAVLLDAGVTRLTFGFQSLDDRELAFLGRLHDAGRCRALLEEPSLAAFASIGVDLMYGLPGQSAASLENSLGPVLESPLVKHLSAYELTVADGTPFGRRRSMLPLPRDEAMCDMMDQLWGLLETRGFMQYEVSNFAKTGHECRHNITYWRHGPYLGLGCAAHSFLPDERSANIRDVNRYCAAVKDRRLPRDFSETLDPDKIGMEIIFLGLRTVQGVNEELFAGRCGKSLLDFVNKNKLDALVNGGFLFYEKPFWKPTKKGLVMADGIAREIMP